MPRGPARAIVILGEADSASFAQHATTMFLPHFVGDAYSRQPHKLGKRPV
jgi:hypothetical protein